MERSKDSIGVDNAGLFSFILSNWISRLMFKAHQKGLGPEDIPRGSPFDSCHLNVQRLEVLWDEELKKYGPNGASLSRSIWRFSRNRIIADWLAYLTSLTFGYLTPMIFMHKLLEFVEDPQGNILSGLTYAFLLMLSEISRTLFFSWRWVIAFRTATRVRVACLGLMYKKITRLNKFEEKSMGQLINTFANDSQKIFNAIITGPQVIAGPLVIVVGVVYMIQTLGIYGLSGIVVFVAFSPVQYFISQKVSSLKRKTAHVSDKRVSVMNEILLYMKTIKMNAWEDSFENQIHSARASEQRIIERSSYIASIGSSLIPTISIISSIVTFLTHIGAGNTLTAAQAFSVQAVFSASVRNVVRVFQFGLMAIYDGRVGLERVQNFLLVEEVQTEVQKPMNKSQVINVESATFSWNSQWYTPVTELEKKEESKHKKKGHKAGSENDMLLSKDDINRNDPPPVLHDINLDVSKGQLVGVCGPIGSGKTSLLLSILGQMYLTSGKLARDGSCAYVSQQAWITNGTIRDNILFGEEFDSVRYEEVIKSCALHEDIHHLPAGDLTEIGERGVNLSGGQKQRISLARALYSNKDIYLLDDPLSAVDVNVGNYIFKNCIKKELKNKSVVLVSHQTQYLSHCDEVYVMKGGCIIEQGKHETLLKLNEEYASLVKKNDDAASSLSSFECKSSTGTNQGAVHRQQFQSGKEDSKIKESKNVEGNLTVKEPSRPSDLKVDTYFKYLSAAGGLHMGAFVFFAFLINVGSTSFSSWWLAAWIKAGGGNTTIVVNNRTVVSTNLADNPDYGFYQTVYASTIGLILLTCALRTVVLTKCTMKASSKLHNKLFYNILHSPMIFFESNPIGRLQNLFSRDMDEVDSRLPGTLDSILSNFWILLFAVLFVCVIYPWYIIAFIPLCTVYYFLNKVFRKGIRALRRLESTTQSPVLSCLSETVHGLNTIRAFNKEDKYIRRFYQLCDDNATCSYLGIVGTRWLAARVDLLAGLSTSITAFLIAILPGFVAPAMAGLALSFSLHLGGNLQNTTRLFSETEMRFVSVERILAYIAATVREGKKTSSIVAATWPEEGRIEFQNVSMSYRQDKVHALKSISFSVLPGQKIGIVGRTGSGKSSLTVALFRLVELNGGCIKLDGVDIVDVDLATLRSQISIIPQDPVIFSGTIRSNLDPRNRCTDSELWTALDKTRLSSTVNSLPRKLDSVIGDGSVGFSAGECQLLCLARALLKNSKVLVLDEATASIDPETEAAVQTTIQEEFKTCTVLIIAHRLSTITNCDQIMVMQEGKVVEFEAPGKLLKDSSSIFSTMMASVEV